MLDLSNPDMDFQAMATSLGVPGSRAETVEEFDEQFGKAMAERGPGLIEVIL